MFKMKSSKMNDWKIENQKDNDRDSPIKINPYDNLPISRRFIDKKKGCEIFFNLRTKKKPRIIF